MDLATLVAHLKKIQHDAEGILYDNTVSGLLAEDVQAAIDEIVASGGAVPGFGKITVDTGSQAIALVPNDTTIFTSPDSSIIINGPGSKTVEFTFNAAAFGFGSGVDETIVRWDGSSSLQSSVWTITDAGDMSASQGSITVINSGPPVTAVFFGINNSGQTGEAFGGLFLSINSAATANYGIRASASNAISTNYAVYGLTGGDAGGVASSYGVYGETTTDNAVAAYGGYFKATYFSGVTTNYGIYAEASGAPTNWAAFVVGDATISQTLCVGTTSNVFDSSKSYIRAYAQDGTGIDSQAFAGSLEISALTINTFGIIGAYRGSAITFHGGNADYCAGYFKTTNATDYATAWLPTYGLNGGWHSSGLLLDNSIGNQIEVSKNAGVNGSMLVDFDDGTGIARFTHSGATTPQFAFNVSTVDELIVRTGAVRVATELDVDLIGDLAGTNTIQVNDGGDNLLVSAIQTVEFTAGNQVLFFAPNAQFTGTTTLNGLTYTWPSSQSSSRLLQTDGSGGLSWVDATGLGLVNSVSNSDGSLTISPTTGSVVASLNVAHANDWTARQFINTANTSAFQVEQTGVNNSTFIVNTSSGTGAVGIGRAPGISFKLDVESADSNPATRISRNTGASATGTGTVLRLREYGASAGSASQGFGPAIDFQFGYGVGGNTALDLGSMYMARAGADNSGQFGISIYNGGANTERLSISNLGAAVLTGTLDINGNSTTAFQVSNNSTIITDSTNARVGIGAAPSTYMLDVLRPSTSANSGVRMTVQTSGTNAEVPILKLKALSTGSSANNFGASLQFLLTDNTGSTENLNGKIYSYKDNNADNSAGMLFSLSNAGTLNNNFNLWYNGRIFAYNGVGDPSGQFGTGTMFNLASDSNSFAAAIDMRAATEDAGAGFSPLVNMNRRRGSFGSGGSMLNGDTIGRWYVSGFTTGNASAMLCDVFATENWGASNAGSKMTYKLVKKATTTTTTVLELWGEGINVGGKTSQPAAQLCFAAGSTSAGTAPIVFATGAYNTSAVAGQIEWDSATAENLTFSPSTTRYRIPLVDSGVGGLTSGRVPFATTNGRLTDDADMTFATDTLTVTKLVTTTSITNNGLTAGRVTFAGASGLLTDDADMTFSADTLTVTKIIGSTSITASNLTSGRVVLAGTGGILQDDADLTFATDTLTATKFVGTTSIKVGTAAGYISSDGSTGATGTATAVNTLTIKDGIVTNIA